MEINAKTGTILDEIVAWNRAELARRKERVPLTEIEARAAEMPPARDFAAALRPRLGTATPALSANGDGECRSSVIPSVGIAEARNLGEGASLPVPPLAGGLQGERNPGASPRLIAEIKRASPSKGPLFPDLDPAALARDYEAGGAAALSVLTEPHFFQGSPSDLQAARAAVGLPALRKDFLFDPYQLVEARAIGADAALLIVAVLEGALLGEMLALATSLGLAVLVECHDAAEVERALAAGARILGINNRDLRTFQVDIETTRRLRGLIPEDRIVVSESGIHTPADVARLREWGVDAMLVGESLVRSKDVAATLRELGGINCD